MDQSPPEMMTRNKKGQALIENLVCLLFLKALLIGFLLLAYQIAITQWVDFWSYRTLICLM